jgi:hypothetical protein
VMFLTVRMVRLSRDVIEFALLVVCAKGE